jgi:hypothetical protein
MEECHCAMIKTQISRALLRGHRAGGTAQVLRRPIRRGAAHALGGDSDQMPSMACFEGGARCALDRERGANRGDPRQHAREMRQRRNSLRPVRPGALEQRQR